jgi:8-oxo-dGTP pyrophosphatase MutT (NUDIX family)
MEGKTVVLLAQHSQHHGWVFPKGLIGDNIKGEKKEETAVREVEEETGVVAQLGKPLSPITYWYLLDGEKRKKTVYYYLMEYISEDVSKKDDEMEQVEWLPMNEVEKKLTYESDKTVWKEAKELIAYNK